MMSSLISSRGAAPIISDLTRNALRKRAEEIVNRLDQEEPLLNAGISNTHNGPMSLSSESTPYQIGVQQQIMLSPIAEQPGTEDVSPSFASMPPFSHHSSQPQFSSLGSGYSSCDIDGPGHTSMDRASAPPQSIKLGSERTQEPLEQEPVAFPKQVLLHHLNTVSHMCVVKLITFGVHLNRSNQCLYVIRKVDNFVHAEIFPFGVACKMFVIPIYFYTFCQLQTFITWPLVVGFFTASKFILEPSSSYILCCI